jgi:hypothetical protein
MMAKTKYSLSLAEPAGFAEIISKYKGRNKRSGLRVKNFPLCGLERSGREEIFFCILGISS